jgi:hypothetical protein
VADEALALLRQIADDVRAIRELVAATGDEDGRLLEAISRVVTEGELFTSGDLIAVAEMDEDFAMALRPVAGSGRHAGLRLGKAFERLQTRQVGPFRIQRGPPTREGATWGFARVSA